jgi:pyruvate/2-oxoglutarate dehydrogenase complex dihydrolipoamide dehydrogenase (E3) component
MSEYVELPQSNMRDQIEIDRMQLVRPVNWQNPKPKSTYNLVVIGAGTAGLVAAHGAAALGAKVALIERDMLGGDCLNVGCVPSKSIIRSSRLYTDMRNAAALGVTKPIIEDVNFPAIMQRMQQARKRISLNDSVERLTLAGVDVFFGSARFASIDELTVDGIKLKFKKAMIATGSRPDTPLVMGLEEGGYFTNETIFETKELPRRLMVIGGGPLGCELAQAFSRFGSQVTIAQDWPLFLPKEERDAAQILSDAFANDGIDIRLNTKVVNVRQQGAERLVDLISDDYQSTVLVDAILTGTGRLPNVEGLNLEAAGVQWSFEKGVEVNDFLQTSNRRIYAAGDVCLEHKYTHSADAAARIVLHNALFMGRQRLSKLIVPWCTYTDPEIAHVGLYVRDAQPQGILVKTFTIPMHDVDRAITDGEDVGFVKIHIENRSDKILGATIVARHAGEMINEITLAMGAGLGMRKLANVIHTYPTQTEAIKKAADAYNRTRVTPLLLKFSQFWLKMQR